MFLSGCSRLASIPYDPPQTPAGWLTMQPFMLIKIGGSEIHWMQPSSTLFVYLLGLTAVGSGLYFWRQRDKQQTRRWWSIALILWGLGALAAGTSYQAFSYEIKCAGQSFCSWTSWWEIAYLILSAGSVDAMLAAVAFSSSAGKWRKALMVYALLNITLYAGVVLIGALALIPFLISFELLLIAAAPNILLCLALNIGRYRQTGGKLELALGAAWIWLGLVLGGYFLYLASGLTHQLWARGIWFSENDVLHLGLISWMIYLVVYVARRAEDAPA